MALIFLDQTPCALCGDILRKGTDIRGFPPLMSNMNDPLYIFSDNGVHQSCLDKHPLGEEATYYADKATIPPASRTCIVSGKKLDDYHFYIGFGLLTSDRNESLYQFNFLQMDRRNLPEWKDRSLFIEVATKFIDDGKWNGFMGTCSLQQCIEAVK